MSLNELHPVTPYLWEILRHFRPDMRVPARVYATRSMLEAILDERSLDQLVNVATLPGIEKFSLAMPDIHQGYGFPIGGVAAMRTTDGAISPGGVGYDINCGVRLLKSQYLLNEICDLIPILAHELSRAVPSGVGRGGRLILSMQQVDEVLAQGLNWALDQGLALQGDLDFVEERGCLSCADPKKVSDRAKERGRDQLGTIGAGNHFLEVQEITEIYDASIADIFELAKGYITIMIHTGSRGLGHQICTDYVRLMNTVMTGYNITLPDRELACAPFRSQEGQDYFSAMSAAANFAWTNRAVITHNVRQSFERLLGISAKSRLELLYDVAHNMAKVEEYDGKSYIVHRKGATRAFGPRSVEVPEKYRSAGQPVLIPGSMGTASYVLAGTEVAMTEAFGSCCHGAGRQMSRMAAKKTFDINALRKDFLALGIILKVGSPREILEEAPGAYKDVDEVIDVVVESGLAKKVAKLRPLAVIKG